MTEQVYFALSQDGLHWEALNGGDPVLVSTLGEQGVRDPFVLRSHDGKKFYLLATDLSAHRDPNFDRARRAGSQSIVIWDSEDLVHWSEPRLVEVAADDAGSTWAPEAVYDEETGDYLVFWASMNARDNFAKHHMWAARTKDFKTFGLPFTFMESEASLIDADIVRDGDKYYRFTKNVTSEGIMMEVSENLRGPWTEIPEFPLAKSKIYEGPLCFRLSPPRNGQPATWCLLVDAFLLKTGYQAFLTQDVASGQFTAAPEVSFPFLFRHGSVLPITVEERDALRAAYA